MKEELPQTPTLAYVALGSNLGDRRHHLDEAVVALKQQPGIVNVRASRWWETAPVGGPPGQQHYLNGVLELQTFLAPRELLALLLDLERRQGRLRSEPNTPRTLDLDLLLYGDAVLNEPDLIIPHPRMHERTFVLGPLAELAPNLRHPLLGQSVVELLMLAAAKPPLTGLRCLVTGSTSGIGRAIALALADRGADVLVHGYHTVQQGMAVAEQIQARGRQSSFLRADLRDEAACQHLVEEAWQRFGRLDVWVNNAGADTLTGEASRWPFERKLRELWAVDVMATILLSRAVGERMKRQGSGVILTMGWDQADIGMEGESGQLFGATKAAVMAFSKALALSLAPQVRVNCLAPGWIKTAWGQSAPEAWQLRVHRETPAGRWGYPTDVAAVACWLASAEAAFITGQVIRVNGGAVR